MYHNTKQAADVKTYGFIYSKNSVKTYGFKSNKKYMIWQINESNELHIISICAEKSTNEDRRLNLSVCRPLVF